MKKILLFVLVIILLFSCSGCDETPEISFPCTTFYFNEEFNMRIFGLSGGVLNTTDNEETCFEIMTLRGYPYKMAFFKTDNLRSTVGYNEFKDENFLFGATGRIDDEENLILELDKEDIGKFFADEVKEIKLIEKSYSEFDILKNGFNLKSETPEIGISCVNYDIQGYYNDGTGIKAIVAEIFPTDRSDTFCINGYNISEGGWRYELKLVGILTLSDDGARLKIQENFVGSMFDESVTEIVFSNIPE